jgi:hypothetical protein
VSDELPAANGTTMVTGRVGQLCAEADPAATIIASTENAASMKRFGLNIVRFPQVVLRQHTQEICLCWRLPERAGNEGSEAKDKQPASRRHTAIAAATADQCQN